MLTHARRQGTPGLIVEVRTIFASQELEHAADGPTGKTPARLATVVGREREGLPSQWNSSLLKLPAAHRPRLGTQTGNTLLAAVSSEVVAE